METRPKPAGWIPSLLIGLVVLLTLAGIAAALVPVADCPHCLGRGLHRMIDPQRTPELRGVEFQPVGCAYCADRKSVSFLKSRRWRPEDGPRPPIFRN